ncbi:uncharacterized protein LOC134256827 [Saccostrea cucullata]|uniref:uncharacterized protein LOC134256827 n=1 Tax=Saccostrea cuccullata TaxID=36930 RepID=UPI002ED11023
MFLTKTVLFFSFFLALCVYKTEACLCPTEADFNDLVCNGDYAVVATVKKDPDIAYRYTLDVQENYKVGDSPTEIYTRSPQECGVDLESGQTYILGGFKSDSVPQVGACDFIQRYNGYPPPTPMCANKQKK